MSILDSYQRFRFRSRVRQLHRKLGEAIVFRKCRQALEISRIQVPSDTTAKTIDEFLGKESKAEREAGLILQSVVASSSISDIRDYFETLVTAARGAPHAARMLLLRTLTELTRQSRLCVAVPQLASIERHEVSDAFSQLCSRISGDVAAARLQRPRSETEALRLRANVISPDDRERIRRAVGAQCDRQFFGQLSPGVFKPGADVGSMLGAVSRAQPNEEDAISEVAAELGYDREVVAAVWATRGQE